MKKTVRIIIIVLVAVLACYLIMCAHFTHKVKSLTDKSGGLIPYEKQIFLSEQSYYDLSPEVLIELGKKNGDFIWDETEEEISDAEVTSEMKRVTYDWTGFSYAYFDFSEGGFVVVTPFDFSADYDDGNRHGVFSGHCNRRVTIAIHGSVWRISDIYSGYEV